MLNVEGPSGAGLLEFCSLILDGQGSRGETIDEPVVVLIRVRQHSYFTMKTKISITVSVVIALAIGFAAGKFQASSDWAELYAHDAYQRAAGDAGSSATLLTWLRTGHETDVQNFLERSLDSALLSLDHLPRKQWTPAIRASVIQARSYRLKYPWDGTPPEIEPGIQRALDSVEPDRTPES